METQGQSELTVQRKMLPPTPRTFRDREDLITYVRDFGAAQGYVVTIKKSRRDRRVILGCDRGGVYRNRRKIEENQRKRKASSRLINCPFEAIGKKEDDEWVLTVKNGEHNHEALKDMSEHPYSRRFTEEEVRQIKQMTEAGVKPRQVLKALKQTNPELQSTPRHLYNLKAKIRQGNISEKSFKSWRPNRSITVNTTSSEASLKETYCPVPNFIGGKFVDSQGGGVIDVINPATQEVVSQVPLTTYEEFKDAVSAAKQAFPSWKSTPVTVRQRIMFKLQELIRRDIDKLAMNITIEQGKTLKSAQGDVLRGLEVVEHACGIANLQMGEFIPNASNGIDTYCIREPLGICAGICPFNFPAMIPLWMFPIAITCGNTFVLKPCEKNPGASMILAALAMEAGLPGGVLNIVHGTHDIVNHICDDDDIKAIAFVDASMAGMHMCARATAKGKRVQSNIGAKNHAVIMPDASMDGTLNYLVTAGFGAAGQRSMALSTAVFVGGSAEWEEQLVDRAKALKVNVGTDPSADVGPVISKEVKDRICRLVQSGVANGARLILDGTDALVPGYENGNFVGPTILCDVTSNMECYKEETFGPVLLCMQVDSLEEAITVVNRNKFGNGASIFTTSGFAARKFQNEVEAGLVGINVPVPIPLPFSSFNGTSASFAGDLNFCGKAGMQFYTQIKTVAQQWNDLPSLGMLLAKTGRGGPTALPPTSETDISSQRVSSAVRSESEVDSPSRGVPLSTSETDLPNPEALPTAERDLLTRDLVLPSSSQWNGPLARGGNTGQRHDTYMLGTSRLSDTGMFPSSERLYMPSTSQMTDISLHSASERMYMSATTPQPSNDVALASQRADTSGSERMYMPPVGQRSGSMALAQDGLYGPGTSQSQRMYTQNGVISMEDLDRAALSLPPSQTQRL